MHNKSKIAKITGLTVGMALALGMATTAGAQTAADLQKQVDDLLKQLAALQGGSTVITPSVQSVQFTMNLTVGSRGTEVTALQNWLISKGHSIPAGATGYFGSQTKAAVAAFQSANGITPAAGYFGPKTRAAVNSMAGVSTGTPGTPGTPAPCPAGYVCTSTGSAGGVITTPGVEGTITVSLNPSPSSGVKLYENEKKRGVLGIKLEAKNSDIKVERVKIDMDNVTSGNADNEIYRKISNKVYVMDGSTVLASSDLNATTVVKDGSDYFITMSGLSFIVPKDTIKVLTIALDANGTWDSTYDNDAWTLGVPVDGVRGVDGAGVNQFGPSTGNAFTREWNSAADLVDSANFTVSLNSDTPAVQQVICEQNTDNDECDLLEIAKFNFKAEKDKVKMTDLVVDLVRGGTTNTATTTTAYLYDGSTLVGSASVAGTSLTAAGATFSKIDYMVDKDTTKTLSFKVDVRDAGVAATTYAADIDTADVTSENSAGGGITETGTAQGKTFTIRKVGPQVTLVSKSIVTSGVPQGNPAVGLTSTSTLSATFNIKIKSLGGDILLGTVASGTPTFASSTTSFRLFRNGSADGTISAGATSTSYSIPGTCVSEGTNSCLLSEGAEVTIPVTWQIIGRTVAGAALTSGSVYSVQMDAIQYVAKNNSGATTTDFMTGEADWRTADVSFP